MILIIAISYNTGSAETALQYDTFLTTFPEECCPLMPGEPTAIL